MALDGNDLATAIRTQMGFPAPNSTQIIGFGQAIVEEIVNFAQIPQPFTDSSFITNLNGPRLADDIALKAGYPFTSSELITYATEIVDHIMDDGRAKCSTSEVILLNANTLAQNIANALFGGIVSTALLNKCTAIVNYIMDEAEVLCSGLVGNII